MSWILANVGSLVEILIAVLGVASLITGMLNRPKAAGIITTIIAFIDRFSVLTHKDAAGTVKLPGTASQPILTERTDITEPEDIFKN